MALGRHDEIVSKLIALMSSITSTKLAVGLTISLDDGTIQDLMKHYWHDWKPILTLLCEKKHVWALVDSVVVYVKQFDNIDLLVLG